MSKPKYVPGGYALRVGRSATGRGLFAGENIPKGACIVEYIGRPIGEAEASRSNGKYLFEVARGRTIDGNIPANLARHINHSCAPNCEAIGPSGRVFIFSTERVAAGEELVYDYGKEYFDRHIEPKGCRCRKCQKLREA